MPTARSCSCRCSLPASSAAASAACARRPPSGSGVVVLAAVQYGWLPAPETLRAPLQQGLLPAVPLAAYTIVANVGGCIATALLVGHLSESLTRTGADLQRATTSLADLTTLSQRVIDSMAGGLIVTDAQGVVVLFNRTAETITAPSC